MAEKKRKTIPTQELFVKILSKLDRIDGRLKSIEIQQTLTQAAFTQQGTVIEEINKRCMQKLGLKCPVVQDEEDEENSSEENNNEENGNNNAKRRSA